MYRDLGLESTSPHGIRRRPSSSSSSLALGFDDDGAMTVDGEFGTTTRNAVRQWQDSLGVDDSGVVTPRTLVFHPTPLRLATDLRVGTTFETLEVTAPDAAVTVDASSDDRGWLAEGTAVTVEFADGSSLAGNRDRTAGSVDRRRFDGVPLDDRPRRRRVRPTRRTSASSCRRRVAEDVLIVPVAALLAPAEGGYAVEIVDGATHATRRRRGRCDPRRAGRDRRRRRRGRHRGRGRMIDRRCDSAGGRARTARASSGCTRDAARTGARRHRPAGRGGRIRRRRRSVGVGQVDVVERDRHARPTDRRDDAHRRRRGVGAVGPGTLGHPGRTPRLRLPAVPPAGGRRPRRQRRRRPRLSRVSAPRAPAAGPGRARPRRAVAPPRPPTAAALGRRAAAGGDRQGDRR